MQFKFINAQDCYPLRSEVLYNGNPFNKCHYDGDETAGSFHVGAFESEVLIAVATFIPNSSEYFNETWQYQLRGMASAKKTQGKGVGKQLIAFASQQLQQLEINLLWCNAREKVVPFYEKCGFSTIGIRFMITEIGWHQVMYKQLMPT